LILVWFHLQSEVSRVWETTGLTKKTPHVSSAYINEDLQCAHGALIPDKNKYHRVEEPHWKFLKSLFPSAIEFEFPAAPSTKPASASQPPNGDQAQATDDPVCAICKQSSTDASRSLSAARKAHDQEKTKLSKLRAMIPLDIPSSIGYIGPKKVRHATCGAFAQRRSVLTSPSGA
jgi:hypothetical protein